MKLHQFQKQIQSIESRLKELKQKKIDLFRKAEPHLSPAEMSQSSGIEIQKIYRTLRANGIKISVERRGGSRGIKVPVSSLGSASDSTISKQFGVSRQRIHQLRVQHNIPAFSK